MLKLNKNGNLEPGNLKLKYFKILQKFRKSLLNTKIILKM